MLANVPRALIAGALSALAACGTARVIQRTPYDGVIELQGDHNKAMERANEEMAGHCGSSNFTVMSDEAIRASTPAGFTPTEPPSTPTAWRIRYQCGEGAPVPAVPPPASPPRS
jgi:hypothetical protein